MGENPGVRRLTPEREAKFPRLADADYEKASDESNDYNCIAFAAGDFLRKWDCPAFPVPGYYWPPGAQRGEGPDALVSAFETIGYEVCANPDPEEGFEKVALYIDVSGHWSHAAKQTQDGQWISKLGDWEDIRHATLMDVGEGAYGSPCHFMRRKVE